MSTLGLHFVAALAVASTYPLFSGHTAEAVHRHAKDAGPLKWFLLGGITDLRTLKIFHRCLGILIVAITIVLYLAALYHDGRR